MTDLRAKVRLFIPKRPVRDTLIRQNLWVVDQVVHQVAVRLPLSARTTKDELRSAGYLGLIQAAEAFDHTRGVPFGAFCRKRIQGAMLDQLREDDPYSRDTRQLNKAGRAISAQLRQDLGREPTREEVASALGEDRRGYPVTPDRFDQAARLYQWGDDDSRRLSTLPAAGNTEAEAIRREQVEHVWAAILTLPRRLQRVIVLYYFDDKPMVQVGVELGVNESRISQLHARAIRLLRLALTHTGAAPLPSRVHRSGAVRAAAAEHVNALKRGGPCDRA
jgi:RNA polymerase sigma factor for flagellar operon FliA